MSTIIVDIITVLGVRAELSFGQRPQLFRPRKVAEVTAGDQSNGSVLQHRAVLHFALIF